jgi:hypothetical protein
MSGVLDETRGRVNWVEPDVPALSVWTVKEKFWGLKDPIRI